MEPSEMREIFCRRDGLSIYGVACVPQGEGGPYPTVLIGHGFSGTYRDNLPYAEYLAHHGIAAYCFDFCGGSNESKSDGKTTDMSLLTEAADMEAVVETLQKQDFVDPERLFLMGESQGGFAAALAAAKLGKRVCGLLLLYPALVIPDDAKVRFPSFTDIVESELWGIRLGARYYTDVWDMDVYGTLTRYQGPVLIFHGTNDRLVPLSYSQRAAEHYANAQLFVMRGAGHGFSGETVKRTERQMVSFIEDVGRQKE